eukprot:10643502-Heterocapsa_arctica.AAC.1
MSAPTCVFGLLIDSGAWESSPPLFARACSASSESRGGRHPPMGATSPSRCASAAAFATASLGTIS